MSIGNLRIKKVSLPPFSDKDILRYAGIGKNAEDFYSLINECKTEIEPILKSEVVYREFSLEIKENYNDFGCFAVRSEALSKAMRGSDKVIFMAVTLGIEVDRLIAKYSKISPAKAHIIDSIATERIEAVCDAFCQDLAKDFKKENLKSGFRFSPGYGDLSLDFQRNIFLALAPQKYIGLTLNKSLMMSPSKSVSAIVSLVKAEDKK